MPVILRILQETGVCKLFVKVNMKAHLNLAAYGSDYLHVLAPLPPGGKAFSKHCAGGRTSQRNGAEDNRFCALKFSTVLRRNPRDLRNFCTMFVNFTSLPFRLWRICTTLNQIAIYPALVSRPSCVPEEVGVNQKGVKWKIILASEIREWSNCRKRPTAPPPSKKS